MPEQTGVRHLPRREHRQLPTLTTGRERHLKLVTNQWLAELNRNAGAPSTQLSISRHRKPLPDANSTQPPLG